MFYVAWYTAPSGKWILEMRLVPGHFGDGVWSPFKRQEERRGALDDGFRRQLYPPFSSAWLTTASGRDV